MKHKIPESEVDNLVSVYWQLLREVEEKTDPSKNVLDKILVEGAYNVLNRCGITENRPRWERQTSCNQSH